MSTAAASHRRAQVIESAIRRSNLRELPADVLAALLTDAVPREVAAGATVHREGETMAHVELVLDGALRVFVRSPDGRTLTVRYCRPGALIGVVSIFSRSFSLPAAIQALTHARLLAFRPSQIRAVAERDSDVATALLAEVSERALSFIAEIPGSAFATVRQRVARHLLDLALDRRQAPLLVAAVSQQDLADAVGSVREVVVRVLRDLRAEGLVRTGRDGIAIVSPERLADETFSVAGPDRSWNAGS